MARIPFSTVESWMARHEKKPADAARDFGVSTQRFNGWRSRAQVSADKSDNVARIMAEADAARTGVPAAQTHVRILHLDADAGMGDGIENPDYPEIVQAIDFTESFIRAIIGFVPRPGRLRLVTGRNDSMIPVINPGDVLIVDTGITHFDGDGIYLINTGSGQQIKSLQDRNGTIYVVSANASLYPAYPMGENSIIGGKVFLRNRIDRLS